HRELRAGFADGLRGDHAYGLADLDHAAAGQVAPVAARAGSAPRFASQHGADLDALDARRLNGLGKLFGDLLIDVHDQVAFVVFDLVERDAAHHAVAQRLDFDAGLDDRLDVDAVGRSAVDLADDNVLRHVHQAAGQRSEEHTSELQSRGHLVCRLLLEKKKKIVPSQDT